MDKHKTIFITGADGFIGGRIAERLFLENLAKVKAGVKDWLGAARIGRFPIEIVKCDVLSDVKNLVELIKGTDTVIHCAYGNKLVNERGTENLLNASLKAGIKRFIYFSTVEVYSGASGEISELTPLKYSGNEYADSKINAEKIVREYQKKGLPITILRPTMVYGPFCRVWTINVAERLLSGNWKLSPKFNGFCQPVYVDDMVDAVLAALNSDKAVGESFNVGNPQVLTWADFFKEFNNALGLLPLKIQNSGLLRIKTLFIHPIRKTAAHIAKNYLNLIKKICSKHPFLKSTARKIESFLKTSTTKNELSLYERKAIYITEKAYQILGYRPCFDLKRGLQLTSAWLRHNGYESPEKIKKLHPKDREKK